MALTARMVTIDCAEPLKLAEFWCAAAGYRFLAFYGESFVMIEPPSRNGLRLGLQKVPEERAGKNRAHIDWITEDRLAEVDRLVGLGATVLGEHSSEDFIWTVLADPEGNEFCVAAGQE